MVRASPHSSPRKPRANVFRVINHDHRSSITVVDRCGNPTDNKTPRRTRSGKPGRSEPSTPVVNDGPYEERAEQREKIVKKSQWPAAGDGGAPVHCNNNAKVHRCIVAVVRLRRGRGKKRPRRRPPRLVRTRERRCTRGEQDGQRRRGVAPHRDGRPDTRGVHNVIRASVYRTRASWPDGAIRGEISFILFRLLCYYRCSAFRFAGRARSFATVTAVLSAAAAAALSATAAAAAAALPVAATAALSTAALSVTASPAAAVERPACLLSNTFLNRAQFSGRQSGLNAYVKLYSILSRSILHKVKLCIKNIPFFFFLFNFYIYYTRIYTDSYDFGPPRAFDILSGQRGNKF